MTIATAYWCILLVAVLPYIWTTVAKASGTKGRYDNRDPRGWQARQENPRSRAAYAAHLNAFEAFPAFAAGVLGVAHLWANTSAVTQFLPGDIAGPDERHRALVGRRGAESPGHGLAHNGRRSEILEADAVENVLTGRQVLD